MNGARSRWRRLPPFLRWLYPGLQVKRWLLLLLLGLAVASIGTAFGIGVSNMVEIADAMRSLIGPAWATRFSAFVGAAVAAVGLALVLLALLNLVKAISDPLRARDDRQLVDVLLEDRDQPRGPSVVAIGGGTGLSNLLRGLKQHTSDITAIAAVSDDGGSSGRLQREMKTLPPGDVRNCLVALADDEALMGRLLQYRFEDVPSVEGHSLGNLFIAALASITGDFERAVRETSKVLAIRGRVLPATLEQVTLCGRLEDGAVIRGETHVGDNGGRLTEVFLDPGDVEAAPEAVAAIKAADIVVIGPGSTFTSLIPNLLVPGVARALRETQAVRAFVCNVMTQPGETDGLVMASDQVRAVMGHVGGTVLDFVLINDAVPNPGVLARYEGVGARIVEPDAEEVGRMGAIPICGDLISTDDYAWHDPDKLAPVLLRLAPVTEPVI